MKTFDDIWRAGGGGVPKVAQSKSEFNRLKALGAHVELREDLRTKVSPKVDTKSNLPLFTLKQEREQLIQVLLDRGWTQNVDFFEPPGTDTNVMHIAYKLVDAIKRELRPVGDDD